MKSVALLFFILAPLFAHASRARVGSLGRSEHLIDTQVIYRNPLVLNYLPGQLELETGVPATSATISRFSFAEATVVFRGTDDRRFALSFGHQEDAVAFGRYIAADLNLPPPLAQNPIGFFYAKKGDDFNFSYGLTFSNFRDEFASEREKSAVLRLGYELGAWQFYGLTALQNEAHYLARDFEGSGLVSLHAKYFGESVEYFAEIGNSSVRVSSTAGLQESHDFQTAIIGFVSPSTKEGNDVFWGMQVEGFRINCSRRAGMGCSGGFSYTTLPFLMGFEMRAMPWLTLRGSFSQAVLLNQVKDEIGYNLSEISQTTGAMNNINGGPNNTTVNMGCSLNFGQFSLDGLLTAAQSQKLNQTDFLNQIGLKYSF